MDDTRPENPQIILIIAGWPSAYETADETWKAYDSAQKANFMVNVAVTCPKDDPAACHVQIEGELTHYKYIELPKPINLETFNQLLAPA